MSHGRTRCSRAASEQWLALGVLILAASASSARAPEMEPRAYVNTPIGMNFLLLGELHTDGNVAFDPALLISDAKLRTTGGTLGLAHTLDVAGQSAHHDVVRSVKRVFSMLF